MKIVGFSQLHNEKEKGNLENWFRCMNSICDKIYIYDQASTDGSVEFYKTQSKARVIYSDINNFNNEIECKKILLEKLLKEQNNVDWIFWMDGDTIMEKKGLSRENMVSMLTFFQERGIDGLRLGHYNLWRSKCHYRVDDSYHSIHNRGVMSFWRNNGNLKFPEKQGLHHQQFPEGINNPARTNLNLLHMGFATDYQIIKKYDVYKERGQNGWALDRLLSEKTLRVEELNKKIIPNWIDISEDVNPLQLRKIREIYDENK